MFSQSNSDSLIIKNKVKRVKIFDSENKLVSVYEYDIKGRLILRSMDNFTSAIFLKTSETNIYDENDNLIKTTFIHSSFSEPRIWIKDYDKNKNLVSIKNDKGDLVFQFFYDGTNFKNKEIMYDVNKISQTTVFERLDNGKTIVSSINGDFIKGRKNSSFYDDNKNEIKTESYDFGKLRFSSISTYEKNRLVKIIYNETQGKNGNNYFYDSKNRLVKRQLFDIEKNKEILGKYEVFEYSDNDLIKKYSENIYSLSGLNEYRYEYNFFD
jgi:hypothetical protein